MNKSIFGLLTTVSISTLGLPVSAETVYLEDIPHELYLVRDNVEWFIANPQPSSNTVFFNIFANGSIEEPYSGTSLIVEAECTGRKQFVLYSMRNYLKNGGFHQDDEEQVYMDLPQDSPFGMAQSIVCAKYYSPSIL